MAGAGMQIAGNIFNEMVMEEAIKDKTAAVEKEMAEQEAAQMGQITDAKYEEDKDSDDDFNSDGDDAVLATLREQRLKAIKAAKKEE